MSSEKREKRVVRLIREKVNREMEEAATMSGCSFKNNDGNECRCNVDDAMMRCNKQIKTQLTRKTMKASGASVSGRYSSIVVDD